MNKWINGINTTVRNKHKRNTPFNDIAQKVIKYAYGTFSSSMERSMYSGFLSPFAFLEVFWDVMGSLAVAWRTHVVAHLSLSEPRPNDM